MGGDRGIWTALQDHQTAISELERGGRCKLRFANGQFEASEDTARACCKEPQQKPSVAGSWIFESYCKVLEKE